MTKSNDPAGQALSTFVQLCAELRKAEHVAALGFVIVNMLQRLLPYDQAAWLLKLDARSVRCQAISSVAQVNEDAPYVLWLQQVVQFVTEEKSASGCRVIQGRTLPKVLQAAGLDWLPKTVMWCPMQDEKGQCIGGLWLVRTAAWTDADLKVLNQVVDVLSHAYRLLCYQNKRKPKVAWSRRKRWTMAALFATLTAGLFVPVHQTVLAAAEIVAKTPHLVAAPMDGVIESIAVTPNQRVAAGQLLFTLESRTLRHRFALAEKALAVAQEKYRKAAQDAFQNPGSKAELAVLAAMVRQKQVERDHVQQLLSRVAVRAEHAGLVMFSDKNDWLGKPVAVGERVMQLANPDEKALEAWLPVTDAIRMHPGADVRFYLNVDPLHPLQAQLERTSYSATERPDGRLAYRVKANFSGDASIPRIGLKGTAKCYGETVRLGYYLFWKPVATLRRVIGV